MTKVTIKQKETTETPVVHKIGNWYRTIYGDYAILANVQSKAVLIYTDGSFHATPVNYKHCKELTQEEFEHCCGYYGIKDFNLVTNITISEE